MARPKKSLVRRILVQTDCAFWCIHDHLDVLAFLGLPTLGVLVAGALAVVGAWRTWEFSAGINVLAAVFALNGFDLLLFVKGDSLQKVASFVSEKLSTVEGVLSTSTHFTLRCYKDQGFQFDEGEAAGARLNVAP